jgi:hypothetical protein
MFLVETDDCSVVRGSRLAYTAGLPRALRRTLRCPRPWDRRDRGLAVAVLRRSRSRYVRFHDGHPSPSQNRTSMTYGFEIKPLTLIPLGNGQASDVQSALGRTSPSVLAVMVERNP